MSIFQTKQQIAAYKDIHINSELKQEIEFSDANKVNQIQAQKEYE